MPHAADSAVRRAIGELGVGLRQRIQKCRHGHYLLKSFLRPSRSNIDLPANGSGMPSVRSSLLLCRRAFGRPIGRGMIIPRGQSRRINPSEQAYRNPLPDDLSAAIGAEMAAALRKALSQ
jgi:hypothetical protein